MVRRFLFYVVFYSTACNFITNFFISGFSKVRNNPFGFGQFVQKGEDFLLDFVAANSNNIIIINKYSLVIGLLSIFFLLIVDFLPWEKLKTTQKTKEERLILCFFAFVFYLLYLLFHNTSNVYQTFFIQFSIPFFLMLIYGTINTQMRMIDKEADNLRQNISKLSPFGLELMIYCLAPAFIFSSLEMLYSLIEYKSSIISVKDVIWIILLNISISTAFSLIYWFLFSLFLTIAVKIEDFLENKKMLFIIPAFLSLVYVSFTACILMFLGYENLRYSVKQFRLLPELSILILNLVLIGGIGFLPIIHVTRRITNHNTCRRLLEELGISIVLWPLFIITDIMSSKRKNPEKTIRTFCVFALLGFITLGFICYYAIFFKFYNYGRFLHGVALKILIYISILGIILLDFLLKNKGFNALLKTKVVRIALIGAVLITLIISVNPWYTHNSKHFLVNRTEISRYMLSSVMYIFDLDRDGFSYIFDGGDRNDFSKDINPYRKENFKASSCIKNQPYDNPINRDCNISKIHRSFRENNIILISVDALRSSRLSCYGYHRETTPHIDRFAQDSILFLNSYSASSASPAGICGMLTGKYCSRYGPKAAEVPNVLDYFIENPIFKSLVITKFAISLHKKNRSVNIYNYPSFQKSSVIFEDFLRDLKEKKIQEPFFLWFHIGDTHFDFTYWQGGKFFGNTTSDLYDNRVSFFDNSFGRLIKKLQEFGIYEHSIIIITSDHGTELKEHGLWFHGPQLYEESVKVPLIVHIPGVEGKKVQEPVQTIDVVPTILDLLKIQYDETDFDGKSLTKFIFCNEDIALNRNLYLISGWDDKFGVIYEKQWKFIYNRAYNVLELYNLKDDPYEMKNLADIHPEELKKGKTLLFRFLYDGMDVYGDPDALFPLPKHK